MKWVKRLTGEHIKDFKLHKCFFCLLTEVWMAVTCLKDKTQPHFSLGPLKKFGNSLFPYLIPQLQEVGLSKMIATRTMGITEKSKFMFIHIRKIITRLHKQYHFQHMFWHQIHVNTGQNIEQDWTNLAFNFHCWYVQHSPVVIEGAQNVI